MFTHRQLIKVLLLSTVSLFIALSSFAQTQINWGTFISTPPVGQNSGSSYQRDLASDAVGNIFGAGNTQLGTAPVGNASGTVFDNSFNSGWDGYIYKISSDGKTLNWWTYIGGGNNDDIWGIEYSKEGANEYVYAAGFSDGTISIPGAKLLGPAKKAGRDAFLAKFDALTGDLVWFQWIGTAGDDCGFAVKISNNYVHLVGTAGGTGLPTTSGAYKTTTSYIDGFYARYDFAGTMNYCTYTGFEHWWLDINYANGAMGVRGLDVISDNDVLLAGATDGGATVTEKNNSSISGGTLPSSSSSVGFVMRIKPGNGGGANDLAFASLIRKKSGTFTFCTDVRYNNGDIYLLGYSDGVPNAVPASGVYQSSNGGGSDVFVFKLNASSYAFTSATMYGGNGNDYATSLNVCSMEPTFSGQTNSTNLPVDNYLTTGSLSSPTRNMNSLKGGPNDMFVASLKTDFTGVTFASYIGGSNDEHPFTSYTLKGKTGGHALNGGNLIVGASSHSFSDMPTTTGAYKTTTQTALFTAPDMDFLVSFPKPGGTCALTTNIQPALDLDSDNSSGKTSADYQTTYTEQGTGVNIGDTDTKITDSDNTTMASATVVLTNKQTGDYLVLGTLTGITATVDSSVAGKITISLSGITSLANYEAAIKGITFKNGSDNPSTVDRIINVTVNDGGASNNTSNTAVSTIHFTAVNDNPVLDLDANDNSGKTGADYQTTYTENGTGVTISDVDLTITDLDNTNLASATIILTNKFNLDDLRIVGSLPSGISSTGPVVTASNITITLTGSATIANYISAIKQIQFSSTADNPNTTDRIVTVVVNDGAANSNTGTTTIKFTAVNDNPQLDLDANNSSGKTGADYQTTYTENQSGVQIGDNADLTITDADNSNLTGATVVLTNKLSGDSLIVVGSLPSGITAVKSSTAGTITITLSGSATIADYQTALKQIQYMSKSEDPSTTDRIVNVQVNDGSSSNNLSNTAVATIKVVKVNDNPVLDLDGNDDSGKTGADYQTTYTEKGANKNIADVDITITDVDNTSLSSATIILTNKLAGDTIKVGTLSAGITSSVTSNAGTITITLSGAASLANYQTSIRNIVYGNSSSNPSTTDRFVTVLVNDGTTNSNTATATIHFTAVNDNPNIDLDLSDNSGKTGNDYQTTYTEQGTGVTIGDSDTKVTDVDNTNLSSATIVLINKQVGDYLVLGTLNGGITATVDSSVVGVITITLSGSATLLDYETAVKTITFKNGSDNPVTTDRIINVSVNDGSASNSSSGVAVSIIHFTAVNDVPLLDLDADNSSGKTGNDYQTTFTEQGSGVNIGDVVDTKITDTDNTNLSSATIVLTNKQVGDYLVLGTLTGITATVDSSVAGKITVTFSGSSSIANYETAIKTTLFQNGADDPSTVDRIITVLVNDGTSNSAVATSTIHFTAVNDVALLDLDANNSTGKTGNDYQVTYTEKGNGVTIGDVDTDITDVDNTNMSSATIVFTNKQIGDYLVMGTLTGITASIDSLSNAGEITVTLTGVSSIANYETAIKSITFKNGSLDPSTTDRIINVTVNDGTVNSAVAVSTIHFTAVNDNPSLDLDANNSTKTGSDYETTFTENTTSVNIVDTDVAVTDVDNTNIASSTIVLTNRKNGDTLVVGSLPSGITANVTATSTSITVVLSGSATKADYETALKAITFDNQKDYVDETTRVINVLVNDGALNSNTAVSYIKVVNVNDDPIVDNEHVSTNEDVKIVNSLSTLLANDVDPDNDVSLTAANTGLTVTTILKNGSNGTAVINGSNYEYDPVKFFYGEDTVVFNVCDPKGACRPDTLFITVNPVNDSLLLDLDVNNSSGKTGADYQTVFTENDAHLGINISDVDVSIFNPDKIDILTATFTITNKKKGDTLIVDGALASGLTANVVSTAGSLVLTITGAKDSTTYKDLIKQIQFNNIRDDVDTTTRIINVTVANANGNSNLAQSFIKVINVNDSPVTTNEYITIKEDSVLTNTLASILVNDYDLDGDPISVQTIEKIASHGSFTTDGVNYTYTPNKDFNGKDTVIVSVCDTKNACVNDTIFFTITPVNDNPVLDLDKNNNHDVTTTVNYQTTFGTSATSVSVGDSDVLITDVDNTSMYSALIKLTNTKANDSLIVNGTLPNGITDSTYIIGDTTYVKLKGKASLVNYQTAIKQVEFVHTAATIDSTDRIIYVTVNDSLLNSNIAITTISIINRSPLITNDVVSINEDSCITSPLSSITANDQDPEGNVLTVTSISKNGSNGTITIVNTNYTYCPKKDFNGKDTVIVTVCDIHNECKNDTIFVNVKSVNDNPVLDLDADDNSGKTGADYTTEYVENNTGVSVADTDLSIQDVDNKQLSNATLKLVKTYAGDTLKFTSTLPNGVSVSTTQVGDTMIVSFTGLSTIASYQNIIKNTVFASSKELLDSTDRIVYVTVKDSMGAISNLGITTITIKNVNDNPIVTVTSLTTKEDSTITDTKHKLLINDKDPEGDTLTLTSVVKDGSHGTFVINQDSTYSYTPDKDFNGKDTVIVSVCDPQGLCSNKTIIITVTPVNDSPVLDLDKDNSSGKTGADYTTSFIENGTKVGINDNDIEIVDVDNNYLTEADIVLTNTKAGDTLVVGTLPNGLTATLTKQGDSTIVKLVGKGTLVQYQNAISAVSFVNNSNNLDSTTRVINVTVNDSVSTSNVGVTTIKVTSINDDPLINNDTLTVVEDNAVTRTWDTILKNDSDPENTTLTVTGIAQNGNKGTVTFNGTSYTYNPNQNANGKDTVVFTVCDAGLPLPALCKNDTLFINIIPVNDTPVVVNEHVSMLKNNSGTQINYLANDSDVETKVIASGGIIVSPTHGKVTGNNPTTGVLTYTPDRYFVGQDTIVLYVCDQGTPLPTICKNDTIFIDVNENNLHCTVLDLDLNNVGLQNGIDYGVNYVENSGAIMVTAKDVLMKDQDDNELSSMVVELVNVQPGDSVFYDGGSLPGITFTPAIKFNDTIRISFTGQADTNAYKFALTHVKFINNRNDISTTTRVFNVFVNDGKCLTKANSFIYIQSEHDNAYVNDELYVINEDSKLVKVKHEITDNDYSPDGDGIKLDTIADHIVKNATKGKFVFESDSTFSYTPNKDFNGRDTVVVKVCDNTVCYNDTIFIIVDPVVDSIIVNNEYHLVNQGETITSSIIINDYNPDGTGVQLSNVLISHISHNLNSLGTLSVTDDGQFTYVANTGVFGVDQYVYTVCSSPNSYSCDYDTLTFVVGGEVIPDGFSPGNGDGINDTYKISFPQSYGEANLTIYNRWGDLVFEQDNYPNTIDNSTLNSSREWDGTSNKGLRIGNDLPSGTYFIHIKFTKMSDKDRIVTVTLQR